MKTFLDFETTFQVNEKGNKNPSPYLVENYLVSGGYATEEDTFINYDFYKHNAAPINPEGFNNLAHIIKEETTELIAYNAKFELSWLKAIGLDYTGKIADPMIREYVLARGRKWDMSLEAACVRRNVELKKSQLVSDYLKKNIGFEEIPWEIVQEYGIGDIQSLLELYYKQLEILNLPENIGLWPTINLMEEYCKFLTDIEFNGVCINREVLDELTEMYGEEYQQLTTDIEKIANEVMGDTPINLDSPEQLSQLMYSRKVKDKKIWGEIFNLGSEVRGSVTKQKYKKHFSNTDFVGLVQRHTDILYRTVGEQCDTCHGNRFIFRSKVSGGLYKRRTKCYNCTGKGYTFTTTNKIAGLKLIPITSKIATVGGFATDKDTMQSLLDTAKGIAKEFLEKQIRLNSVSSYKETYLGGIKRNILWEFGKFILHTNFMQCVTATGRLSSRNPNFQNQPRSTTFPIRRVVISRFLDGKIIEGDYKQLEFRVAGELSDNEQIYLDVIEGIDVHAATAKHTGKSRQDAKSDTFAPLFGAVSGNKTGNIATYYEYFIARYGLKEWQDNWITQVIDKGYFKIPSGREFVFEGTVRYPSGAVKNATIIKNYPIQGFATADLAPIGTIEVWKLFKQHNLQSKIILVAHDSVVVDAHPDEIEIVAKLLKQGMESLPEQCIKRYNYKLKFPFEAEIKIGESWYGMKDYDVANYLSKT